MELYSEYDFYVIDEADFESHNTVKLLGGEHIRDYSKEIVRDDTFGMICHNPLFEEDTLDRIQRCGIRDKNSPCVVMWSMGNESGYDPNIEKAADWIKEFDPEAIVHYEGSIYEKDGYMSGLGSNSCSQPLLMKYQIKDKKLQLKTRLSIFKV